MSSRTFNAEWGFGKKFILGFFIFLCFSFVLLYKPLPEGFTETRMDRFVMHLVEPSLRAAYYYPSRMFSKASDMVWWTRITLDNLSSVLGMLNTAGRDLNIESKTWNGVPVRVYSPKIINASSGAAVVFIHGGGFALGSVDMYDGLVRRMAYSLNTVFVSIEYRLVPETVFPGGIMDCEAAVDYLFEKGASEYGIDTTRVIVMGDSAGGNLATVLTQRRTDRESVPSFAGQVLIYPLLQMADMQTISYRYFLSRLNGYALVDPESVAYYYMFYAGINMDEKAYLVKSVMSNGHISERNRAYIDGIMEHGQFLERNENYNNCSIPARWEAEQNEEAQQLLEPFLTNPDFSPLMKEDLSKMPTTLIITCEFDILRDEGIIYAKRLQDAGVSTTLINYKNGFHGMLNFHSETAIGSESVEEIMDWTSRIIFRY